MTALVPSLAPSLAPSLDPSLALPPLTAGRALTTWTADGPALAVAAALLVAHLALVARVRARGGRWPLWRTAAHAVLGPGVLVVATCSVLQVYRTVLFWPAALASTLLAVVVPAGLALGDPVALVRAAGLGRAGRTPGRVGRLGAAASRALRLPVLGAAAGLALQCALWFTPVFAATLTSRAALAGVQAALVAAGALFAVPLLGGGAGGAAGPGLALLAFVDGVVDAVPGMVVAISGSVVAGGWYAAHAPAWAPTVEQDQLLGGSLMVTVAEVVGVPLLVAACVRWARSDARGAAALDAALDAAGTAAGTAAVAAGGAPAAPDGRERPWWEVDDSPLARRLRERDRRA